METACRLYLCVGGGSRQVEHEARGTIEVTVIMELEEASR